MSESGLNLDLQSDPDPDPRHPLSRSDRPLNPSILDLDCDSSPSTRRLVIGDLMQRLDRGSCHVDARYRRLEPHQVEEGPAKDHRAPPPPEWALLLVGCLLGLATGVLVATFNIVVHVIHEWAWAGTPNDGASWLRLQRPADTWHRILLIPVTGGVVVGMIHGLLEISYQLKPSKSLEDQNIDWIAGVFPIIKAIQAAITLGTGCSLGPEGPSVDIGKSCAKGCSEMIENNRERRIALLAAGAAAGIASGSITSYIFM